MLCSYDYKEHQLKTIFLLFNDVLKEVEVKARVEDNNAAMAVTYNVNKSPNKAN